MVILKKIIIYLKNIFGKKIKNLFYYEDGPPSYQNWKFCLKGHNSLGAVEYPLFTDSYIIGQITDGLGPYKLFNTVPIPTENFELKPSIVLRFDEYMKFGPESINMNKTNTNYYHGGELKDEIAALISLSLGIRIKAGGISRDFDLSSDPKGRPIGPRHYKDPVLIKFKDRNFLLPSAFWKHSLNKMELLKDYYKLNPHEAIVLIRSARFYQEAVWIIETTPEISWIMFVSAIETAANQWRKEREPNIERMKVSKPELEKKLMEIGGGKLVRLVADEIADSLGMTKKFIDFIIHFLPNPPEKRPPEYAQISWDIDNIKKVLRTIYNLRSYALHRGIPFPIIMCELPFRPGNIYSEKPHGIAFSARGGVWKQKDIPIYIHIFEYIARNALLKWWESMIPI